MSAQTTRQIERQIDGTKNVKQITHAMELVSAAKLKRVEDKLEAIRPYWQKVREIFGHLIQVLEEPEGDLLQKPEETSTIGLIVIAGEKGLCGGYNAEVFEKAENHLETFPEETEKKFIAIGKKTRNWLRKKPYDVVETRLDLPTEPSFHLAQDISNVAKNRFLDGTLDEVHIVYTEFINALKQKPKTFKFLPVEPESILRDEAENQDRETHESQKVMDYIFEPAPDELLNQFLPRYVNMLFYTVLLESLTSEHGARMVAMRDATDNAEDKIEDLTHTYNQARQESITRELLDIVGAVEALEGS